MSKFIFDNSPGLKVLTEEQVKKVHEEALRVLENMGVIFDYPEAREALRNAGCKVDEETKKVYFSPELVNKCIETAPETFDLYDRNGDYYCTFGDGKTRFNPGSSSSNVLEPDNHTAKKVERN